MLAATSQPRLHHGIYETKRKWNPLAEETSVHCGKPEPPVQFCVELFLSCRRVDIAREEEGDGFRKDHWTRSLEIRLKPQLTPLRSFCTLNGRHVPRKLPMARPAAITPSERYLDGHGWHPDGIAQRPC